MSLFEPLIAELAGKFGLGARAAPFAREIVHLVVGGPGGFAGFLDRVRASGLGAELLSWLGNSHAAPLASAQVENLFGAATLSGIAHRLGLGESLTAEATGFALPKLVGLLTPGGAVPAHLPDEVAGFVAPHPGDAHAAAPEPQARRPLGAFWSMVGVLSLAAAAALLTWLFSGHDRFPTPSAQTPQAVHQAPQAAHAESHAAAPVPPAPAVKPATVPATLTLSNDNGLVRFSGVVADEASRTAILDQLTAAYGADKIQGEIKVDGRRAPAPWLEKLRALLASLKIPGLEALFSGRSISVGGPLTDAELAHLSTQLTRELGGDWKISSFWEHFGEVVASSNANALAGLASLKDGFSAGDLVGALNLSIINFATASADIPEPNLAVLRAAAALLKRLPPGAVIEISGYTDNTGADEVNIPLSQRRAAAVRSTLVDEGVDPAELLAKGYGSANPVAPNDTAEGRFRNRRIEYRVGR